jgi:hypothetical protein
MKNNDFEVLAEAVQRLQERRKIFGIDGLAKYLQCSRASALTFSKSGKFPRYQLGGTRKIFFFEDEVLGAMSK